VGAMKVVLIIGVLMALPALATGQDRATIQDRFAVKTQSVYGHGILTTHLRNDFYDSWGVGADVGFYFSESLGAELRGLYVATSLGEEAKGIQEKTGLTPDARPQQALIQAGVRWSLGYGKVQFLESWVVYFDPQLVLHGGVALAEVRVLPTLSTGLSFLTHWQWGIQAKLDLNLTWQSEQRDRGRVLSMGFMPILGVGWAWRGGP